MSKRIILIFLLIIISGIAGYLNVTNKNKDGNELKEVEKHLMELRK
jgi:hypothetical protein